jgi:sporulation protein YlmC with PRC-barrel domain
MSVRACSLRNDKVFTSDKKKLGTVVNIVFNTELDWPEAKLLIFPDGPSWVEKELGGIVGEKAVEMVKDLLPEEADKITKDIQSKGTDTALRIWKDFLKKKEEKAFEKFHLIPILEINEFRRAKDQIVFKSDRIILKGDLELETSKYCFADPNDAVSDTEVALYKAGAPEVAEDEKILWPISLNLPCIQGLLVRDCGGARGRIDDVQLNFEEGTITDLVVKTLGKGAGEHVVSIADFDFSTSTCKRLFSDVAKSRG